MNNFQESLIKHPASFLYRIYLQREISHDMKEHDKPVEITIVTRPISFVVKGGQGYFFYSSFSGGSKNKLCLFRLSTMDIDNDINIQNE